MPNARRNRLVHPPHRTATGTVLAVALALLATAVPAHADDFGLGEVIGSLLGGAVGDSSAAATQTVFEGSGQGIDHTLATTNPLAELSAAPGAFGPQLHAAMESWIKSPLGQSVDGVINQFAPKGAIFIGNGADGTATDPDGQNVLWFGDGGNGWNSTEAGVAGGDGGNGGALIGNGGNGGNAGDGATTAGLPALGGAGGLGGLLGGSHGTVGDHGTLVGGPPAAEGGGLSATDSWITDSDGRVVMLHGLNEVYKVAPYEPSASGFSDDDAAFLAANGFNAVRLGVIWAGVEPEPGVFSDAYLASIAQTAQILANHGIHVVLDMHQDTYGPVFGGDGAPAWATDTGGLPNPQLGFPLTQFVNPAEQHDWGSFWTNSTVAEGIRLQNNYAQMWEHIANYFANAPGLSGAIAGYEVMNEPYAQGTLYGLFGTFGTELLTPFYNQVDSAIRAVDPNTPVFFEPNAATSLGSPIAMGTVNDPNSVLSFHAYCYAQVGPLGCFPDVDKTTDSAQTYAQAHNIPAFMSEFGATSNIENIDASMQQANQHLFGWTEWEYSGRGDIATSSSSANDGALVFDPSKPPVGDNVDTAKLATLAEPYPQVVAGTPGSWSFADGTFKFSYSTEMADGSGTFGAGSQTTISTPAVEFPNGYQVTVAGGHVISAPNTAELVIASDGGAHTITVTVSPTGGGSAAG